MVRLAEYSRDCLKQLRADTGIAYDERSQGTLQLFRTQKQLDGTARTSRSCSNTACPSRCWTARLPGRYEPALALVRQVRRCLRLPGRRDRRLLQVHPRWPRWRRLGVRFRFG
jgi:D-amino-acid dehydrogenase